MVFYLVSQFLLDRLIPQNLSSLNLYLHPSLSTGHRIRAVAF